MKRNHSQASRGSSACRQIFFRSSFVAFCALAFSSCIPTPPPSIESTPDESRGVARVEVPNGTFSMEVVYPDRVAPGELVTLKDSKGYTSNLRAVANQMHEIRAEEPLTKGDLCKIVYYFKGWNNGTSRVCERIGAAKIRLEIEKNFGDTPAPAKPVPVEQTPEPSRALLLMVGFAGVTLRRRRKP